jgi:3-phosphoshikimate 1-carboxyvinyltransferase
MKWIRPSKISGTLRTPASKSMMLRATAAALLSKGESQIINPSFCDDALAGLRVAGALGGYVEREGQLVTIKGGRSLQKTVLNCNESGLCMRMFTPVAALYNRKITITGTGSLMARPMEIVERPLNQLGAYCKTNNGFPPIHVKGPIKGGKIRIDGFISSQFLTGLLMALPLCQEDSELIVNDLKSKPYVTMTLFLLDQFGISIHSEKDLNRFFIEGNQFFKNTTCQIEGDWSAAAFLLVAGAISGKVKVSNLQPHSLQADKRILEVLELTGAELSIMKDTVSAEQSQLKAIEFDATDCPDLFPPLVALACSCSGRSRIAGVKRLKHKESDRAHTLLTEFSKIGAKIMITGDWMEIEGIRLKGGIIESHNDHRIAMAGAVAGLNTENGVFIDGWKCVSKSYPCFFEDLKSLGGNIV